jgi:hypothetical protein
MKTHIVHPFEKSNLGLAPFRLVNITEKWYVACQGAPKQPSSSCDFCGTCIAYEFWIRSSDGKEFKVGCDCVRKTGDAALTTEVERAAARLKLDLRHEKEAVRIASATQKLQDASLQGILASLPHPYNYQASKGLTRLDWATWMMLHAGNAGKMEVARFLDKIQKGKIDIGTQELREQEAAKLAAAKSQVANATEQKRQDEAARRKVIIDSNAWVIAALEPYRPEFGENFVVSVINQLSDAKWAIRHQDLSPGQKRVVAEILSKEAGRKGSTAFTARFDSMVERLG